MKMFNFVNHQSKITMRYSKHIFAIIGELGWRGDSVIKRILFITMNWSLDPRNKVAIPRNLLLREPLPSSCLQECEHIYVYTVRHTDTLIQNKMIFKSAFIFYCVCVCACTRERDRDRKTEREHMNTHE